jgi:hypothetical protein
MAKKTANTRSTAQRNKPKTQKSIELVRQASTEKEVEVDSSPEQASSGATTSTTNAPTPVTWNGGTKTAVDTASNTSASARLAARRQAAQKTQRSSVALITSEHYRYVRNDLIYIAILAIIMFSILIALFFVLR